MIAISAVSGIETQSIGVEAQWSTGQPEPPVRMGMPELPRPQRVGEATTAGPFFFHVNQSDCHARSTYAERQYARTRLCPLLG